MNSMNIPAIQHRIFFAREQVAIRDSIYNNIMNNNFNNSCHTIIEELQEKADGNLFGVWDAEINNYI